MLLLTNIAVKFGTHTLRVILKSKVGFNHDYNALIKIIQHTIKVFLYADPT